MVKFCFVSCLLNRFECEFCTFMTKSAKDFERHENIHKGSSCLLEPSLFYLCVLDREHHFIYTQQ